MKLRRIASDVSIDMLTLYSVNRQRKEKITDELSALIERAISETLAFEGIVRECEVSLTYVSDRTIRQMNAEYRGIDKKTDVLSFPIYEREEIKGLNEEADDEPLELGDIVLSLERARAQAELYGHPFEREAAFLTVHSTLHLLGYDHELGDDEEMDMRERQRQIMKRLGLTVSGDVK